MHAGHIAYVIFFGLAALWLWLTPEDPAPVIRSTEPPGGAGRVPDEAQARSSSPWSGWVTGPR